MNEEKKVKVKANDNFLKGVEDTGGKKWDLKVKNEKEIKFDKLEKDKESTDMIDLEISEAGKNVWKAVTDAKIVYKKTLWREGFHIKDTLTTASETINLKPVVVGKRLNTDVNTYNWPVYVSLGVGALVLLGLGYYFFFSREDKEEEGL